MNIGPENVPRQTLFVANLTDKVHKSDLVKNLFETFVAYGDIADIKTSFQDPKRGHAFVCFRDISSATNALRQLQAYNFLGRKLRLQYARSNTDSLSKSDANVKHKRKMKAVAEAKAKAKAETAAAKVQARDEIDDQPQFADNFTSENPTNILYVQNLPEECTSPALEMLFRQYPGYIENRLIEGRRVAFVEYQDELQSAIALSGLQGFKLTDTHALRISFAKQ
eukprot:Platyproteum_vivax@DN8816_c0_g1_i1.p1